MFEPIAETHLSGVRGAGASAADADLTVAGSGTVLRGPDLRAFLTLTLHGAGGRTMRVEELVAALHGRGFRTDGRAGKAVSDALRWEIGRRRVERVGRGRYASRTRIPRSTLHRLRGRLDAVRAGVTPRG